MRRNRLLISILVSVAAVATGALRADSPPKYTLTRIGPEKDAAGAALESDALGISDNGAIVGYAFAGHTGPSTAWLRRDGHTILLGPYVARGINSSGQFLLDGQDGSFVWQDGKTIPVLGLLTGGDISTWALNDHGQVVGFGDAADSNHQHAFLWQNSHSVDLGTLDRSSGETFAYAVNNRGQVVGLSTVSDGHLHAFLWQDGQMKDLGTAIGGRDSTACAINDRGQLVGTITRADDERAFLYDAGRVTELGVLPGDDSSWADGINALGEVVGRSEHYPSSKEVSRAFLYKGGKMYDLNALIPLGTGWQLQEATAVNNRGQIIGNGLFQGRQQAFLLTPK